MSIEFCNGCGQPILPGSDVTRVSIKKKNRILCKSCTDKGWTVCNCCGSITKEENNG